MQYVLHEVGMKIMFLARRLQSFFVKVSCLALIWFDSDLIVIFGKYLRLLTYFFVFKLTVQCAYT